MIHFLAGDGIKGDLNQDLVLLDLGLIAPTILNLITNAGVNLLRDKYGWCNQPLVLRVLVIFSDCCLDLLCRHLVVVIFAFASTREMIGQDDCILH